MTIPPLSFKVISQEDVDRENAETPKLLENAVGDNFIFCQMKLGCVTPRSEAEKKRWLSDTKKIQQLERDWTEIKGLKDLVSKEDFVNRIDTLIKNLTIFRDARKSLFEETPLLVLLEIQIILAGFMNCRQSIRSSKQPLNSKRARK